MNTSSCAWLNKERIEYDYNVKHKWAVEFNLRIPPPPAEELPFLLNLANI